MENIKETAKALQEAAKAIANVCDGAVEQDGMGFNSKDTYFGRYIVTVPIEDWDGEVCSVVHEMLATYKRQLDNYDIDYSELPKPKVEWKGNRKSVNTRLKEKYDRIQVQEFLAGKATLPKTFKIQKYCIATVRSESLRLKFPRNAEMIADLKSTTNRSCFFDGASKTWVVNKMHALSKVSSFLDKWDFIITDEDREFLKKCEAHEEEKESKEETKPNVTIEDDVIVLSFPYNAEATAVLRGMNGRRWNSDRKVNTVKIDMENILKIKELGERLNWKYSEGVLIKFGAVIEATESNIEASRANDADVEIENFGSDELKLRPFQKAGVAYAIEKKQVFIADEMGLGKTIQALGVMEKTQSFPTLVICPMAVKLQWAQEAKKWMPHRSVSVVTTKNVEGLNSDIYVVNYDIITKVASKLPEMKTVVLDESHYVKNPKAARTKAIMEVKDSAEIRLCLTGTSVLNKPVELATQLDFLGQLDEFGGFFPFAKRYCAATQTGFGWDFSGASNLEELSDKLRSFCYIRREKKDVAKEMPEIQRSIVPVMPEESEATNNLKDEIKDWAKENRSSMTHGEFHAKALQKIEQLRKLAVKEKYESCIDWIKNFMNNTDEKLVVFAHHRNIQSSLLEDLSDFNPAKISGDDNHETRETNKQKFWNDDSCRIIVCSLKAANVGLNLQNANNVAFVEYAWHAADMDQAEARVHRIGTTAARVSSYWLMAPGTFDSDQIELIERKREITDTINEGKFSSKNGSTFINKIFS